MRVELVADMAFIVLLLLIPPLDDTFGTTLIKIKSSVKSVMKRVEDYYYVYGG